MGHPNAHGQIVVAASGPVRTFGSVLLTCQAGYESLLARELEELHGGVAEERGPGWVRGVPGGAASGPEARSQGDRTDRKAPASGLAFAHLTLHDPVEIRDDSVNALAARIAGFLFDSIRSERIEAPWPSVWMGPSELVGLGRRIGAVESACGELLKKRLSRVAKLARADRPRGVGPARGLFAFFTDFGRVFVAREAFVHGPRRMADDDLAPSRSYLKLEEAYLILGHEPKSGETACDLGAAPGGWSYSAAKRGARVVAVDNGPLKGGALNHPQIDHRREDAFKFIPGAASFDWLFCDLVEEPHHVLRHILEPWVAQRWCRHFVVNLKFGRVDAIALLRELQAPVSPLVRHAPNLQVRHLYHDREEFTLAGSVTR